MTTQLDHFETTLLADLPAPDRDRLAALLRTLLAPFS